MYAVNNTETKLHSVIFKSYFPMDGESVYKRPVTPRSGTTDHSSSKRSKRDPRAKQGLGGVTVR